MLRSNSFHCDLDRSQAGPIHSGSAEHAGHATHLETVQSAAATIALP